MYSCVSWIIHKLLVKTTYISVLLYLLNVLTLRSYPNVYKGLREIYFN